MCLPSTPTLKPIMLFYHVHEELAGQASTVVVVYTVSVFRGHVDGYEKTVMSSTDSLIMVQLLRIEVVVACENGVVCEVEKSVSPVAQEPEMAVLVLKLLATGGGRAEGVPRIVLAVVMNVVRND